MSNQYTTTGHAGVPGTQPAGTTQPTGAGPHTSRIANAADPRVDSGPGSRNVGNSSGANTTASTGAPLHNSSVLNKLDPRVDSDMDGSRNMGATQTHGQTAHAGGTSGYGTGVGPGVNAGGPGTGVGAGVHTRTGAPAATSSGGLKQTPGTGTATQTAGPHNSNLLNKLDPRVDANMDGSQTMGGNRTYV